MKQLCCSAGICESHTSNAQDVCVHTEQSTCHFEIHPVTDQKTLLVCTGKGCVCLRTACAAVKIDSNDVILSSRNHSNFCICNFVKIIKCDFAYWAPVTSHQLIKTNYTMCHRLSPTATGMDLTLVEQLIKHQDHSTPDTEVADKPYSIHSMSEIPRSLIQPKRILS